MTDATPCPTCGQLVEQPANASPAVTSSRPATHYCPVCGRQYPEDGSCDYGHPNVPQLVPIGQEHAIDPGTGQGWKSAVDETNTETELPPPAEPVYGAPDAPADEPASLQPAQPEPDPNVGAPVEGVDHTPPPPAQPAETCPTCQGNRTVPAPPPAGEVICPTCSGTGEAPAPVQ